MAAQQTETCGCARAPGLQPSALAQVLGGGDDDQCGRGSDVCCARAEALLVNCTQAQLEALRATDTEDDDVVAAAAGVGVSVVNAVYLAGINV